MPELDMNDVATQFLAEMLTMLREGKDFVLAQAPDVIQQWVRWAFVEATTIAVLSAVGATVAWIFAAKLIRRAVNATGPCRYAPIHDVKDGEPCKSTLCASAEGFVAGSIVTAISGVILTCLAIGYGLEATHIYVAPKAWIVERALHIAKFGK